MILFKLLQFLSLVLSSILLAVALVGSRVARHKEIFNSFLADTGQLVSQSPFNYVLNTSTTNGFDNRFQHHHVLAEIGTMISSYDNTSIEHFNILNYNQGICLTRPPVASSTPPSVNQTFTKAVSHVTVYEPAVTHTVTLAPFTVTETVTIKIPRFIVRKVCVETLHVATKTLSIATKTLFIPTETRPIATEVQPAATHKDMFIKLQVKLPDWFSKDVYPKVVEYINIF
ncbi:hypothetical protein BDF21DRAFT_456212 [Thamnidium elegans]|uniref:Uncharacterized protein n=1 Tax=Thamnidium elegans TaxID=101142 RepID=A0A8H7SQM1_9FUNG|nr:hypothetical protein INT48_000261 [Thamnidium elegans]KAI8056394.1 hypothetical protein BDF21DRAFT_456212 [Thamnidium elegans]